MKRILSLLLIVMILSATVIPCSSKTIRCDFLDYDEYLDHINVHREKGDLCDHFVHYAQISNLGEFVCLTYWSGCDPVIRIKDNNGIEYDFQAHFEDAGVDRTYLAFKAAYMEDRIYQFSEDQATPIEISIDQIEDPTHMTMLKEVPEGSALFYYLEIGDMAYYYETPRNPIAVDCCFSGILFEYKGAICSIKSRNGNNAYTADQNSLIGRLLNYETAEAAFAELTAFMDANVDAEEDVLRKARLKKAAPAVAIGATGGVVVVAAATIIPLHIRKKEGGGRVAGGGKLRLCQGANDADFAP